MSNRELRKFAYSLKSMRECRKAVTRVMGNVLTEAEKDALFSTRVSQDGAYLRSVYLEDKPVQQELPFPKFVPLSSGLDKNGHDWSKKMTELRDSIVAAGGAAPQMLYKDHAKRDLAETEKLMNQSGLGAWLQELEQSVQPSAPDEDPNELRRRVETLLNDDRVRPYLSSPSQGHTR